MTLMGNDYEDMYNFHVSISQELIKLKGDVSEQQQQNKQLESKIQQTETQNKQLLDELTKCKIKLEELEKVK